MEIRPIGFSDIPALFAVRTATRENTLSREQLTAMGITEASLHAMMESTHRGWLCEHDGRVVGFAMGDRRTGEMWVIAVLPELEGRGIGRELITRVEDWLWSLGHDDIWLTTDADPTLRAYGFYRNQGWTDSEIRDGLRYMCKHNPQHQPEPGAGAR